MARWRRPVTRGKAGGTARHRAQGVQPAGVADDQPHALHRTGPAVHPRAQRLQRLAAARRVTPQIVLPRLDLGPGDVAPALSVPGPEVELDGRPLGDWAPRERALRLAWLAQAGEASGDLTVRDTVMLGRLPHLGLLGTPGPRDEAAVDAAMDATECRDWQYRRLQQLSGGERQRVLLARALATEAPVLLLDEPTTHLDAPHQVALAKLFRRLGSTHTVVSVLHDLPLALHADRLLVLCGGRVLAHGSHDDPVVHAALVDAFGGAVRIDRSGARAMALPDLG